MPALDVPAQEHRRVDDADLRHGDDLPRTDEAVDAKAHDADDRHVLEAERLSHGNSSRLTSDQVRPCSPRFSASYASTTAALNRSPAGQGQSAACRYVSPEGSSVAGRMTTPESLQNRQTTASLMASNSKGTN